MNKIGKHENMRLIDSFVLNGEIAMVETGDETGTIIGITSDIYGKTFGGNEALIGTTVFPFSKRMEETIGWREKFASIRLFTSDSPIDPTKVEEQFIMEYYGESEAVYFLHYSDLTGYLWTDEGFKVGGHDIIQLLECNEHKFVHMEIELYEECAE